MTNTAAPDSIEVEAAVLEWWQELLNVDSVKPGDRLLELGGNSLVATMLANRIELRWGFRPSMDALLSLTFDEVCALCGRQGSPG